MLDAVIVGGGPAGATAGRLLAEWGYRVLILTTPPNRRTALAECLPPSTRKLFQYLGMQDAIDAAGFYRTTGNTVWWKGEERIEPYPEGWGYQVVRADFDSLLLDMARKAGAQVHLRKVTGKQDLPRAQWVLDCSGRAAVLSRDYHVKQLFHVKQSTIALCGVWRN